MRHFIAAAFLIPALAAAQSPKAIIPPQLAPPAIHVIATGGTISNLGNAGRLTGEQLLKSLTGIEKIATVTVEQHSNIGSGAITQEHWKALAARINELYATRPELRGVVVTHGTDTMEETAYFLDLTVGSCYPTIVTGAMRQANAVGADGLANLYDAIATAATPSAGGRGVMVLLNDEIFAARDVSKMHPTQPNAFVSPVRGLLGSIARPAPTFYRPAQRADCGRPSFDVTNVKAFPRVDIVYSYIGADSVPIQALVAAGSKGIVFAGVGNDGLVITQGPAVRAASQAGVYVYTTTRAVAGAALNPQKRRILLMLALTKTVVPAEVTALMRSFEAFY